MYFQTASALLRLVYDTHPESIVMTLKRAVKKNRQVRMAVARKLVPDGSSLLREAGHGPGQQTTDEERDTFDAFFLVRRRRVCRRTFAAQLTRRLARVASDIAMHGPHDPEEHPAQPDPVLRSAVERYDAVGVKLLRDIAETATNSAPTSLLCR